MLKSSIHWTVHFETKEGTTFRISVMFPFSAKITCTFTSCRMNVNFQLSLYALHRWIWNFTGLGKPTHFLETRSQFKECNRHRSKLHYARHFVRNETLIYTTHLHDQWLRSKVIEWKPLPFSCLTMFNSVIENMLFVIIRFLQNFSVDWS